MRTIEFLGGQNAAAHAQRRRLSSTVDEKGIWRIMAKNLFPSISNSPLFNDKCNGKKNTQGKSMLTTPENNIIIIIILWLEYEKKTKWVWRRKRRRRSSSSSSRKKEPCSLNTNCQIEKFKPDFGFDSFFTAHFTQTNLDQELIEYFYRNAVYI